MLFYTLVLVVLFFLTRLKSKKLFYLAVFALAFFLGFRGDSVGADTQRYIDYYNYVEYGVGHMEQGWNQMTIFFKMSGLSAYSFHFFIASLCMLMVVYVLSRFNDNRIMRLGLFFFYSLGFYLLMFNGMRQMFAGSIILVAFYYLSVEHYKKFLFLVLIASLFHISSVIALFAFFLRWLKLSRMTICLSLIISMAFGLMVSNDFFVAVSGKYAHDIESFGYRDSLTYAIIVGGLSNIFFYYLFIQFEKEYINSMWMKLYFLSIVVMNLTIDIVIGPRIVYVFSICQFVIFALLTKDSQKPEVKMLLFLFGIVTFFRFMIPEMSRTEESLIPYYYNIQLLLK